MAAKLHLIKARGVDDDDRRGNEDRYRFPPHDEVWEVSCEPEPEQPRKEKLRNGVAADRRAS